MTYHSLLKLKSQKLFVQLSALPPMAYSYAHCPFVYTRVLQRSLHKSSVTHHFCT